MNRGADTTTKTISASEAKSRFLRDQARKRKIWEEIESLRKEVSSQGPELSDEERYRLAGMSEQAIQELIEADRKLSQSNL